MDVMKVDVIWLRDLTQLHPYSSSNDHSCETIIRHDPFVQLRPHL